MGAMEPFTVVLVVLFAAFFLGCPVLGAISQRRRRPENAAEPAPKDLHRARRKLSTVTVCSSVGGGVVGESAVGGVGGRTGFGQHCYSRRPWWLFRGLREHQKQTDDTESNAAQLNLGECPICIGPLVPEPAHVEDGRNAREILDGVTTLTSPAAAAAAAAAAVSTPTTIESAYQTDSSRRCIDGDNDGDRRVTVPDQTISDDRKDEDEDADKWWTKYKRQWSGKVPVRPNADGDDDILSLNTCGHAFHSKCLASWFLIDRYDCPMCRAVYYTKRRPSLPARVASSFVPSPQLPSSSGMVMGLVAHP